MIRHVSPAELAVDLQTAIDFLLLDISDELPTFGQIASHHTITGRKVGVRLTMKDGSRFTVLVEQEKWPEVDV